MRTYFLGLFKSKPYTSLMLLLLLVWIVEVVIALMAHFVLHERMA